MRWQRKLLRLGTTRLVLKVGDTIRSAVAVEGRLVGDQLSIPLAPDDDAQALVDLVEGA
ncbi:hypothetical protein ATL42_2363 [Sanguibacter antarcticus]|uniref:Uncharacterized protein n=1 Tax=Sanguibacter antarcticus TaxID=372484 RepID=A0A2A9E6J0_9MICO|nr:hypothetical protein ATL42_2363 [Sanguibacter antarcticus]